MLARKGRRGKDIYIYIYIYISYRMTARDAAAQHGYICGYGVLGELGGKETTMPPLPFDKRGIY